MNVGALPAKPQANAVAEAVDATIGSYIAVGDITDSEAVAIGPYAKAVVYKMTHQVVEHQEILNVNLDIAENPALFQEILLQVVLSILGIEGLSLEQMAQKTVSQPVSRQIQELQLAHEKAAAAGVPTTARAAYDLGMMAAYRRDPESALGYFSQATDLDPTMFEAYKSISWLEQSRAMSDVKHHDYDAAAIKLDNAEEAAAAVVPRDAQSLALLGYCAKTRAQIAQAKGEPDIRSRKYAAAGAFFRDSLQMDSSNAGAHNGLANVYLAQDAYDRAIDSCKQAITLSPRYTFAYNDLAIAYFRKMREEEDAEKWRELCEKARLAWEQSYDLAESDPGALGDFRQQIKEHIHGLKLDLRRHRLLHE